MTINLPMSAIKNEILCMGQKSNFCRCVKTSCEPEEKLDKEIIKPEEVVVTVVAPVEGND